MSMRPGFVIPSTIARAVTQDMLDDWADISIDFNPMHTDEEYAKARGFESTICHGSLTITFVLLMLSEWLGEGWTKGGRLTNVKFLAPVKPGDIVRPKGRVISIEGSGRGSLLECEVWLENQDGLKTITGTARGELIAAAGEFAGNRQQEQ